MRVLTIIFVLFMGALLIACGNSAATYNNQGNEAYQTEQYGEALEKYNEAKQEDPELIEPYYNSGNALHHQGEMETAALQLQEVLRATGEDQKELAQNSFYNLGNTYFKQQDWMEAIDAYQRALLLNPNDGDAKHNLELALQNLQQQQQQQQQNQGQGGGQQPDQPPQEPQQGQGEEEQESGGGSGDQEQDQSGQNNQPDQPQEEGQGELSPEEAKQLLDALGQDSQTLQERLQQQFGGSSPPPAQDW